MANIIDPFILLEAWISNSGDGSASICWFLLNQGPNETQETNEDGDGDDFDWERWCYNEGEPDLIEVRRGGPQHKEAYINAHAPDGETFYKKEDPEYQILTDAGWIPRQCGEYVDFEPPPGWEN